MNSSKLKTALIIGSLLVAFIAVMSISMTASATSSPVDSAVSAETVTQDCEVEPESDSSQCWPDGTACSIFNDQCCGSCDVLIGHAGRCAFAAAP